MNQPTEVQPWTTRAAAAARNTADAVMLRTGMTLLSRADAARWRSARTMADLGGLVIAWLTGEIERTPAHAGGPCEETLPLIPALTVINRGGFVTDNSQLAESMGGETWNANVDGFASDETLARIREATAGTGLIVRACRGRAHECGRLRGLRPCPRRQVTDFWATACPLAADALWATWWVHVEDPVNGRNHLLWPVLATALG
jgi:hypothetical protein